MSNNTTYAPTSGPPIKEIAKIPFYIGVVFLSIIVAVITATIIAYSRKRCAPHNELFEEASNSSDQDSGSVIKTSSDS